MAGGSRAWGRHVSGELVVQVIGGILVLVGSAFAAQRAAKATMTASAHATTVEGRRVDLEEWKSLLGELRTELAAVKQSRTEDRTRIDDLEHGQQEQRQVLQVHSAWDYTAVTSLRQSGVVIADPPPLYPPGVS